MIHNMRTRKEIEDARMRLRGYTQAESSAIFSLEVLLDIRDLLASPGIQNDFGALAKEVGTGN